MSTMNGDRNVDIGTRQVFGGDAPFHLSRADRRQHLYVLGQTGTGKTTLLRNLILQDIEAGEGVAVIDPHGDLAIDLLEHIPPRRADDLVYFHPTDDEACIGLNLVRKVSSSRRHLVASGVVSAFKNIWRDSWGPRLEYVLYAAVAALLECKNVSILGVQRMLVDAPYRAWVVRQVTDPVVSAFWREEFANYDERFLSEVIAPIQNKVGQLLMAAPIRNILGQVRSKIDARFMMDHRRILIANLSKGQLGADKSNLLGSLLVSEFQLAAMARTDVPEEKRPDFYLYIDEAHNFMTDAFTSILSEARKYRLCLTLSHQYGSQLNEATFDAVRGNVGNMISFRVGEKDGIWLDREFGKVYPATVFSSLRNYQFVAKLLDSGIPHEAFLGSSLAPFHRRFGKAETLIRRSREKYGTSRMVVEDRINRWFGNRAIVTRQRRKR